MFVEDAVKYLLSYIVSLLQVCNRLNRKEWHIRLGLMFVTPADHGGVTEIVTQINFICLNTLSDCKSMK